MKQKLFSKAAGTRYIDLCREVDCVLCELLGQPQQGRTIPHHIRHNQGGAKRAPDTLVVTLCYECHQGDLGIHGNKSLLHIAKVDELDLLAMTIARIAGV